MVNFIQEISLPNKPKPISEMFDPASNIGRLKRHINQIKQFEERLRQLLPSPQDKDYSWCVGNFRDQHLTILVETPGQAARLRFQQQLFLEKAQTIQNDIESISTKVNYKGNEREEPVRVGRKLSSKAAESISASAEHIDDDELRAALQRLSKRGGN